MSGTLVEVDGVDTSGTTEFILYDNGGTYTLLGSASNTTAAVTASTGLQIWSYADLVYLPAGDNPANIVVYNQAGTVQTSGSSTVDGQFAVLTLNSVGATGATGATGANRI
jgi:hypothetical protein